MSFATVPEGMQVWYEHHRRHTQVAKMSGVPMLASRGGKTIARLYRTDQDPKTEDPIAVGIAACNDSDNYNKRIGRSIALGRAIKALQRRAQTETLG